MAKINFVGFQEHVEIPENHELLEIREDIIYKLTRDQVFSLVSEPSQLSKWFYPVVSLDSKPGGKVEFLTSSGEKAEALCTSFIGGKEISLLSNQFGEFSAKIIGRKNSKLSLRFRILTEEPEVINEALTTFVGNLREIIS